MIVARRNLNNIAIWIQGVRNGKRMVGNHQFMVNSAIEYHGARISGVSHRDVDTVTHTLSNGNTMEIDHLLCEASDIFRNRISNRNRMDINQSQTTG